MVVVMLSSVGRRPVRKLWLGLPIGTMLHLVFDGAWATTELFWWPLGGWSFEELELPEASRGLARRRVRARRPRHGRVDLATFAPVRSGGPPGVRARTDGCSREAGERCGTLPVVLILVRHGRTALNATGRLQGRLDEPLDDLGILQAKAAAERVGPVDELVTSPLLRARQTADAFGMPYADRRTLDRAVLRRVRGHAGRRRPVRGVAALARGSRLRAGRRRVADDARHAGAGGVRRDGATRAVDRTVVGRVARVADQGRRGLGARHRRPGRRGARTSRTPRSAASTCGAADRSC